MTTFPLNRKKSILFIGEAVSLAHVTRPLVLAHSLDPQQYDIHFACDARYRSLINVAPHIQYWPIQSIPSETFTKAVSKFWFIWQKKEMIYYVNQELELFKKIRPSLIVQDMRFTVSISAELSHLPYATLANVYWSPYRILDFNPFLKLPAHRLIKNKVLKVLMPWKPQGMTATFNSIRKRYGLSLMKNYQDLATHGDYTLYAEPPDFIQTMPMPNHHLFLGPILWSPDIPKPSWWQTWDSKLPLIYITLGSTGHIKRLPEIVRSLRKIPAIVVVATAGRTQLKNMPQNVYTTDYLPGIEVCKLATIVVCNGGSTTGYQAISQGTPVVGIWSNLDQYLSTMTIEHAGAGLGCRASNFDSNTLQHLISTVLNEPYYRTRAAELSEKFKLYDACKRFQHFVKYIPAG